MPSVEAAVLIGAPNICIKFSDVSFGGKTKSERTGATRRTRDGHVGGDLACGQAIATREDWRPRGGQKLRGAFEISA